MNRRSFLRLTALSGMATLNFQSLAAMGGQDRTARNTNRIKPFVLDEVTIARLQQLMTEGKESAASLVRKYAARIEAIDRNGPTLRSVIELNPDASAIAKCLDQERRLGRTRGPLHGIPVLLKDNIATHDRMATTAGSLALAGCVAPRDSFVAEKLRAAGAVILGKTNLSEWANFRGSFSTSGWSARGGQTRNPFILDRNPSGSSSGSAVAVSANLCATAVGTETDGSIISPASFNGIVGIKPTLGLISRSGIIPIARSQDTAGPMARTVTDAAILLGILAGTDSRDEQTRQSDERLDCDYTRHLRENGLSGMRIGVARQFFGSHPTIESVMRSVLATLKNQSATLVDPIELGNEGELGRAEIEVMRYEMKADMNAYLADLGPNAPVRTLQDIIDFNERNRETELRWFGQEELIQSQAKGPLTDSAYREAVAKCKRLSREEGIDKAMDKDNLDGIVAPAGSPAHVTDWLLGDHWVGGSTTYPAVAGYPNITVPAGFISGLPVGVCFFGRGWSEPKLLRIAYGFEQASRARRPPIFLPSLREG